ncbi:MAG: hypothetical protein U1E30_03090 [Rhodoblastus sp.]
MSSAANFYLDAVSGEATRNMNPREYLGNVILLIVGATTRRAIR